MNGEFRDAMTDRLTELEKATSRVHEEASRASRKWDPFHSPHEGYAVVLEELDEVWDEVKANNLDRAIEEMVQVGAMAIRFVAEMKTRHERRI